MYNPWQYLTSSNIFHALWQSSSGGLADARDARSLILKVKDVEAKLGPLEVKVSEKVSEEPNKAGENSSEEPIEAFNKGGEQSSEEDKIGGEKSTETINKVGEELSSIQV